MPRSMRRSPSRRRVPGTSPRTWSWPCPAPSSRPGVAVYGMAELDRGGLWAPALFVGATHVWRNDLAESGGTASFTLDAASVDACPLRLGWSRLVARPCASALVGRLASTGTDAVQ